ncbi:MAG: cadmium-translocating P-type ATPase, partial [Clostridia bacterium]|nr:cadmium-translocating P-type ATPase [Clostridia bacterium]
MQKRHKKALVRIITAALIFIVLNLLETKGYLRLVLFLVPYLVAGYDVLFGAVKNIFRGQMFDEKFLMAIATIGALVLGEYPEAVFVMLFFQVGDLFESIAVGKSRKSITDLMNLNPDVANVERNGRLEEVFPEEIEIGEILVVKPGEKIAIDGVVTEGESTLDTSALTGESMPFDVSEGNMVSIGCININGVLKIRTTQSFENSTASKIMELVENSALSKAKTESFITRFSRYYTPFVVICALLLAIVPSVIFGNWSDWLGRALIFLVVSCPCALVISVPLSFFGGIGASSNQGILVKGSDYIEAMADVKTVVFDKTGTLTKGNFFVKKVYPEFVDESELLRYAASAEKYSNHPIALALRNAYNGDTDVENVEELSGYGVRAVVDGKQICAGNRKLMESLGIHTEERNGTVVYVAIDGKYAGCIEVADEIKEDAKEAVSSLKKLGIRTV